MKEVSRKVVSHATNIRKPYTSIPITDPPTIEAPIVRSFAIVLMTPLMVDLNTLGLTRPPSLDGSSQSQRQAPISSPCT